MSALTDLAKSVPLLRRSVRRTKRMVGRLRGQEPMDGFYTLSPDVLVALVQSLRLQEEAKSQGHDLFTGHGYYEFGMFRGFSFWFAEQVTRQFGDGALRLFGFDSFEGLPRPTLRSEASVFSRGDYCGTYAAVTEHLRKWKADDSRFQLFKGFYSDEMFRQWKQENDFPPISICLIDCDLYDSCVPVLEFIRPLLVPGSILLFDDYNQLGEDNEAGERRALLEFEARYPSFQKEYLFNYGWEGIAFRVTQV